MPSSKANRKTKLTANEIPPAPLKMFLVPCSCGTTFAVAEGYDRRGTAWSSYMPCPNCGKRHDPKNRLLQLAYQRERYWKVEAC